MSDPTLNYYLPWGTTAQRTAFTPNPATPGAGPNQGYLWWDTDLQALYAYDFGLADWVAVGGGGSGTVTNTGTLTAGKTIIGNGTVDVTVSSLTAQFVGSSSGAAAAASMSTAKMLGRATAGSGAVEEIAVTGSGSAVLATSPTLVTPALGTPSSGTLTNCTGLLASNLSSISSIYVLLQDQEAQNTAGGTFSSGAWRTRVLNTEVSDVGGLCSLASNQFTLTAGTYLIAAIAPANGCNQHQLRLQNVTDTTTVLTGQSMYTVSTTNNQSVAHLRGIFTIGASKALELQHQCQTTQLTTGFGLAANFTTEVYAIVELWKIG